MPYHTQPALIGLSEHVRVGEHEGLLGALPICIHESNSAVYLIHDTIFAAQQDAADYTSTEHSSDCSSYTESCSNSDEDC